jgi:hypothetical protein
MIADASANEEPVARRTKDENTTMPSWTRAANVCWQGGSRRTYPGNAGGSLSVPERMEGCRCKWGPHEMRMEAA